MFPYSEINIGDWFRINSFRNSWVVVNKNDEEKMIQVKMIPEGNLPDHLNKEIRINNNGN